MQKTIVFIPGYKSVVPSTKSSFIEKFCKVKRLKFLGINHNFEPESSVKTWFNDLLNTLHTQTTGQLILVGTSLGVWLILLIFNVEDQLAIEIRPRICGIIGVGSGINSTQHWLHEIEPSSLRNDRTYIYQRPSLYADDGYYNIPVSMLLDSMNYLLGQDSKSIFVECSTILIHGMRDTDVPVDRILDVFKKCRFPSGVINELRLVQDGDHRLSRPTDLLRIRQAILDLYSFIEHN